MSERNIVIIHHWAWERMLKRHPRFLEILESGRPRGIKFHLTRSLVAFEDGRRSGTTQTENTVRQTKYGRIRGMVVGEGGRSTGVLQGFYCIIIIIILQINI